MKEENKKIITILVIVTAIIIIIIMSSLKGNEEVSTTGVFDLYVDASFNKEEVLSYGYPTMLDIGGASCEPCKAMAPELKSVNEKLKDKAIIKFVDYWEYPALANQFEFSVIPTQFFYDEDGNLYTTHEGMITEEEIIAIFAEMGYYF